MKKLQSVLVAAILATNSCSAPTEGGAEPASIKIVPLVKSVFPSDTTFSISIKVLDKKENEIQQQYVPSWRTSDTTIAAADRSLSYSGTIRTKRILSASSIPVKIYASVVNNTLTDSLTISVSPLPVAEVSIGVGTTFSFISLGISASGTQFLAKTLSDKGETLTGRPISWTTSHPSIIAITSAGLATGVASGISFVGATSSGKSAWIMASNGISWSNNTAVAVASPASYNIPGLAANTYTDYYYDVPAGKTQVTFTVNQGQGNADIYVMPPLKSNITPCSSTNASGTDSCTFSVPSTGFRQYNVRIVGKTSFSGATLIVQ